MEIVGPEVLLCDTSFISHFERSLRRADRYAHWPRATLDRVSAAHLAITPFTLGEIRGGYRLAGWGPPRIAQLEHRLPGYLLIPLDEPTLDEYARLFVECRVHGVGTKDHQNDLWIAASACSRAIPLVTCDHEQSELPGLSAIYLPPP